MTSPDPLAFFGHAEHFPERALDVARAVLHSSDT
jgi:hypothetical protein